MNQLAEYLLTSVVVIFALDWAYLIPQLLAARVLGLPIGSIRIWGFVGTGSGKLKFVGFSHVLMGGRVHVMKTNPLKRAGEYACVYCAGFVGLGVCEVAAIAAFAQHVSLRPADYAYWRLIVSEVSISLLFYVRQGLERGGDIKGLRLTLQYGWGGLQYGAMVRIGMAVYPKGRYKDLAASDIEIISRRVSNAEVSAKMAWFRQTYHQDRGEQQEALRAARELLAILEESPEVVEYRRAMIQSIAFTEAWVTRSPTRAEALLQSVGPPDKDTLRSGLLAECAVAALHNKPDVFAAKKEQLRSVLTTIDDSLTYDAACWEWLGRIMAPQRAS